MYKANFRHLSKWRATTFSSLDNRVFRRIWMAGTLSNLGSVVQIMAATWLMVRLTDSPVLIASVQAASATPLMLLAMIGGASADIFDRRRQILLSLGFCALVTLILYAITATRHVTPITLLGLTCLISAGAAFFLPAWQALIVDLVSRKNLSSAAALSNLSFNASRGIGPAVGAEIISIAGIAAAFLANFVTYIVLLVTIALWRPGSEQIVLPRQRLRRAIRDGLRYISVSPNIWRLLFRGALFGLGASVLLALPPLLALEIGGDARTYGLLIGSFGGGAVLGALFAAALRETYSNHHLITATSLVLAMSLLGLFFDASAWMSAGLLALAGSAWVVVISTINVAVQLASPRWVAARTIASATTAFQFGISVGAIVWGLIAASLDVRTTFLIAGGLLSVTSFACHFLPVFQPSDEDLEPYGVAPELTAPQIHPRAGPIVVTVNYSVSEEYASAFMLAMQDIRRLRLRDGASHWSLNQDIDDPTSWIERFQSPTWGDYLHRLHRSMRSDSRRFDLVGSFCLKPPDWRRRIERPMGARPLRKVRPPDIPPGTTI